MRSSNSTPRRTSHDLVREMNNLSLNGDSRRISLPQSPGPSPASPSRQRPSPVAAMTSPLERRFSRRMISRHDSVSAIDRLDEEGEMETMVSLESTPSKTLEDRIRESEERLARRSSLRSPDPTPQRLQRFSSVHSGRDGFEVSSRNGATTPNADERSPSKTPSSGGRMGKARPPLPLEFQDTRLVSVGRVLLTKVHTLAKVGADRTRRPAITGADGSRTIERTCQGEQSLRSCIASFSAVTQYCPATKCVGETGRSWQSYQRRWSLWEREISAPSAVRISKRFRSFPAAYQQAT